MHRRRKKRMRRRKHRRKRRRNEICRLRICETYRNGYVRKNVSCGSSLREY